MTKPIILKPAIKAPKELPIIPIRQSAPIPPVAKTASPRPTLRKQLGLDTIGKSKP
jgi:hypothetical protein